MARKKQRFPKGFWTKERVFEYSAKCNTSVEFARRFPGAKRAARVFECLEELSAERQIRRIRMSIKKSKELRKLFQSPRWLELQWKLEEMRVADSIVLTEIPPMNDINCWCHLLVARARRTDPMREWTGPGFRSHDQLEDLKHAQMRHIKFDVMREKNGWRLWRVS